MTTFAEKYAVGPFDPSNPCDQMGERAAEWMRDCGLICTPDAPTP